MMSLETILVHTRCKSQVTLPEEGPVMCDICNHEVSSAEISEVDNSPGPFSG